MHIDVEALTYHRGPKACTHYREREPGRLQLRVDLQPDESVCDVLLEERHDVIEVLILVCGGHRPAGAGVWNAPVHVYLDEPLRDRRVIDAVRGGAEIEEHLPAW
jgi:hypothetical protein